MRPEDDDMDGQGAATPHADVTFAHIRSSQTVDYTFTIMQASMVAFSTMADTKANIMITVCSIVLTIGVTQFSSPLLRWPLVLLTLCTFLALFLAILAVLPSAKYPRRPDGSTGPDVPGFNPLFFGHFAHLTRDRFTAELAHVMSDDGRIYEALAHDLWGQAHVLAKRKYRYLRWAYSVFLAGTYVTMCAWLWTWAFVRPS
jgi:hypothetical protein